MSGISKKFNPANDLYDQPLAYRGTIAPFGTYTNPDGSESAGFAWPGMITEPLNALQRLHENSYTEDGRLGIPNPQYQGNKDDVLTSLLSIYGGNALNPMAKVPANALASSAFKVEGKPALSKFLRHDEDKSLGDTEVTRYLLNLEDKKVARIPADVTRGSESFGIRGIKRSSPPDTVTQKGYDFYGMDHPELDDYVQYKNLWHSQDGLLNHIDKLSERVAKFGLRGHLTPQEVANSKAYYQKLRDHVSSDDWDGSVFSDTGRPSIAGAAIAGENARPGITAYHGSPHDFDKFSLDKIGTGEGAQAYGHGLYFAENEGVAKSYRDQLSGQPYKTLDGAKLEQPGRMYEVRINADPSDFFDYDATVGMQSPSVREVLNRLGVADDNLQGASALTSLGAKNNWRKRLQGPSEVLKEAGIPGIKYLDQTSRTAGEGTSNYVVFDDSLIEILKKYGLAGGAIGASSLFDFNTENQF